MRECTTVHDRMNDDSKARDVPRDKAKMALAPGIAFALRCAAQAPLRGRTTLRGWFVFCCTKNTECFMLFCEISCAQVVFCREVNEEVYDCTRPNE